MRSTRPGAWEYQLDAVMRYTYLVNGARDARVPGHHRQRRQHPLWSLPGEQRRSLPMAISSWWIAPRLPLLHQRYRPHVARQRRYSEVQRELYGFVVAYHKVFLDLIRPGVTAEQITAEAAERMRGVVERTRWSKPVYEQSARDALKWAYHMTHPVGMAVHDVGHYRGKPLQPGVVLTLDPTLRVPEEQLYIRSKIRSSSPRTGSTISRAPRPLELDDVERTIAQAGCSRGSLDAGIGRSRGAVVEASRGRVILGG